jgi:hypothetical protein
MPDEYPYNVPGASRKVKREDFSDLVSVVPVADPNIFSSTQRLQLAQMQLGMAQSAPQMHNLYEAYYRVYSALNVRDIDGILLPQNNQMPRDPMTENSSVLNGMKLKAFAGQHHDAHIATHLMMGMSPTIQSNPMAMMELQQHVMDHVRIKAEEDVEADLFRSYGTDPDRMVSALQKEGMIAIRSAIGMQEVRDMQNQFTGGGQEDPLVALKKQELDQRAAADQAKMQLDQAKLQLDTQKAQQSMQIDQARLQLQLARGGRSAA